VSPFTFDSGGTFVFFRDVSPRVAISTDEPNIDILEFPGPADGGLFSITAGGQLVSFEFDDDGNVANGHVRVPLPEVPTADTIATALVEAIRHSGLTTVIEARSGGAFTIAAGHVTMLG
jgi:hypothetical protein